MTGSNSSVHGENNMEGYVLVTRAEMDAQIDAMGLDINISLLPRWSATMGGTPTTTSPMTMNELQVPLLLGLNDGVVKMMHLMWVGVMEEELTGETMDPVGLLLLTDNELHIMMMICTMMTFQTMETSMMVWEIMNHTPHLTELLLLVAMVVPMTVVREKIMIALQR
jgi:hypothetical protein